MVPGPSVSLLWQTLELGALQEASSPPRTLLTLFKSHLSNSSLLMGLPIVILSLENLQGAYQSEGVNVLCLQMPGVIEFPLSLPGETRVKQGSCWPTSSPVLSLHFGSRTAVV